MNFEENFIIGILQNPSRINIVTDIITPEFFQNNLYKSIFKIVQNFHLKRDRKQYMDFQLLDHVVSNASATKMQGEMLDFCLDKDVYEQITNETFEESFKRLIESQKKNLIIKANSDAANDLIKDDVDKAIESMQDSLLKTSELNGELSKPVDIRTQDQFKLNICQLEEEFRKKEDNEPDQLVRTGFQFLDDNIYCDKGHLTIVGGYAGDGKTSLAREIAYFNILQGLNVLFIPLEMSEKEMRTLFICRHARTFDPNNGVRWVEVLKGSKGNLTKREKELYEKAYEDFVNYENAGKIFIWEAKGDQKNLSVIHSRIKYMVKEHNIDIVIIDYLELVYPKRDYNNKRLNTTQLAEEFKSIAREENVWMVVPHQISRDGRKQAEKRKDSPYYIERDLGESSGIEKNADSIFWIFTNEELKYERESIIGCMKARMGRTIEKGYRVFADFPFASIYQMGEIKNPWSANKLRNKES